MAELLRFADPTVRFQDDFYRAVNGGWLAAARIRDDREAAGTWEEVDQRVRKDLEHIVATIGTGHPRGTAEQVVGDFHASFMDAPRLAAKGDGLLVDLMDEAAQLTSMTQLSARLGLLARHQLNSILNFSVIGDPEEPGVQLPRFSQGGTTLFSREHYLSARHAELRAALRDHVAAMLTLLDRPDPQHQAELVVDLETELALAQADLTTVRDVRAGLHRMRLSEVGRLAPNLNWAVLLGELDIAVEADPVMILAQPDFLARIGRLLMPDRLPAWRAWLGWRVLSGLADYATPPIANRQWWFTDVVVRGMAAPEPRSARVLGYVEHFLGEAMGQLYVQRHFSRRHQIAIARILRHLIEEYRDTFARLHWMTPLTRQRAVDKLDHLGFRVGAPRQWHDWSGLDIRPDDLMGNALRAASHRVETEVDKLAGISNGEEWQIPAQVVNASYDLSRNQIVVPAAFLRPPFFDPQADDAVNFGAIGAIMAHEIGHGFDDRGSRYDGRGRLWEWWLPQDRQNYRATIERFAEQLDAISPQGGAHLDGHLVVDEAISDLGGLTIAWRAWQRTRALRGLVDPEEELIEGLTPEQRFFCSFAGLWRHRERAEHTALRVLTDPHAPEELRCNLTVRNCDPFHVSFGVKPSDPMWLRPGLRITLW